MILYLHVLFILLYKEYLATITSINGLIGRRCEVEFGHGIYNFLVCLSTNGHLNTSGYTISLIQSKVTHVSFRSYRYIGH